VQRLFGNRSKYQNNQTIVKERKPKDKKKLLCKLKDFTYCSIKCKILVLSSFPSSFPLVTAQICFVRALLGLQSFPTAQIKRILNK
jgi:hypothetical protein